MSEDSTRLDKWLWAARFFKTRALAATAIKAGHIKIRDVSGQRRTVKPSLEVKIGDWFDIQRGTFLYSVQALNITDKRQSAPLAQQLYSESEESIKQREEVAAILRAQPKNPFGGKKPDKHTLRKNRAIKRGF